uniref:Uncharacterized protein n=1 Tax=Romanomermis culicivorax TaxID=13658 RepID=A0A915IVZ0_ROMCU
MVIFGVEKLKSVPIQNQKYCHTNNRLFLTLTKLFKPNAVTKAPPVALTFLGTTEILGSWVHPHHKFGVDPQNWLNRLQKKPMYQTITSTFSLFHVLEFWEPTHY